jgi:hypothetical protein
MNLDDAQKSRVAAWIKEGLKLSDIQKRLADELHLSLTYMEVRLLVDDLKLVPKDIEPAKTLEVGSKPLGAAAPASLSAKPTQSKLVKEQPAAATAGVSVVVDQIARPGAVVSGSVTFSDGNKADWYLDQLGRLGVVPKQQGYKPSPADVQEFQAELQNELAKMGF